MLLVMVVYVPLVTGTPTATCVDHLASSSPCDKDPKRSSPVSISRDLSAVEKMIRGIPTVTLGFYRDGVAGFHKDLIGIP